MDNLVERWFAELTNKRIRRGVFRSLRELEAAIREYIDIHNENPKPFVWTRTADQILDSITAMRDALLSKSHDLCHEPMGRDTRRIRRPRSEKCHLTQNSAEPRILS
jgi:hypothetical protein